MTTRTWSVATLMMLSVASPALGGEIQGVLRVPSTVEVAPPLQPYPGRANALPGVKPPNSGAVTDAVIYVDSLPAGEPSAIPPERRVTLAQKDEAFLPRVVAVAAGTTVDFPNLDPIYHNVFSVSPVKRFDLGKYPRGRSKPVTFRKPGLVQVYCDIHSQMAAFVLVLPHHGFAQPDAAGRFKLSGLPAGRYILRVWHPDLPPIQRSFDVTPTGSTRVELGY